MLEGSAISGLGPDPRNVVVNRRALGNTIVLVVLITAIFSCLMTFGIVRNWGASSSSAPARVQLPAYVTPATCETVAKSAKLFHEVLSYDKLGQYYAAWLTQIARNKKGQLTREDTFNAGVAVTVCLK